NTLDFLITTNNWINATISGIITYIFTKLIKQSITFLTLFLFGTCLRLIKTITLKELTRKCVVCISTCKLIIVHHIILNVRETRLAQLYLHSLVINLHRHINCCWIVTALLTLHFPFLLMIWPNIDFDYL